jgi:hypothetical protein
MLHAAPCGTVGFGIRAVVDVRWCHDLSLCLFMASLSRRCGRQVFQSKSAAKLELAIVETRVLPQAQE